MEDIASAISFSHIFAFSGLFAIPSQRRNEKIWIVYGIGIRVFRTFRC